MNIFQRVKQKVHRETAGLSTWLKESRLEKNEGYCNICESATTFIIYDSWLRDNYRCKKCQSIPRNRAIRNALDKFAPNWKELQIHESSPGGLFSDLLRKQCPGYSTSHYYKDVPHGQYKGPHRSEDLTALTFADHTFDIVISCDVFEHVFNPDKAYAEIARVLKPGGMHIFTLPWIPAHATSSPRAELNAAGEIVYLKEAEYHGNPIDSKGSLVTHDWGRDIADFIYTSSRMTTTIYLEIDRAKGLDAKMLEVFISRKAEGK